VQLSVVVPSYGPFGDPAVVRALIVAAEDLGYDGAWLADHVALPEYATPFLPPPKLAARAAWETPAPVTHAGARFPFADIHPVGPPLAGLPEGTVPLWVGGNIGVAFRRAARSATGGTRCSPRRMCTRADAPRSRPSARGWGSHVRSRTRTALRSAACSTRPATGRKHSAPRLPPRPPRGCGPSSRVHPRRPRPPTARPLLTGTPAELRAGVAALAAAGVEHVLLRFWTTTSDLDVDGVVRQFELFAEQVTGHLS